MSLQKAYYHVELFLFIEFQKQVIKLLVEINENIKTLGHKAPTNNTYHIPKAEKIDDMKKWENRLKTPEEREMLVSLQYTLK